MLDFFFFFNLKKTFAHFLLGLFACVFKWTITGYLMKV